MLEQCERAGRLSLKHVDLCEAQVRAYEPFVELNGFPEEDDALVEALALEADRAQHGIGGGLCRWIAKRPPRLSLRLVQPSLLDEMCSTLKGFGTVSAREPALAARGRGGPGCCHEDCAQDQRNRSRRPAPPAAGRRRSHNPRT